MMTETSKEVCGKNDRAWAILTGWSAALFVIWLIVGGYRWEGYPCFTWNTSLTIRALYFLGLFGTVIAFVYYLLWVVIDPGRFNRRVIFLAFVNFILLRIILGSGLPLLDDEAYHWLWPQFLDWCYYDHGGLLGWLCYPFRIVSKSVVSARSGPILMGTLTAILTWRLAFWLTRDSLVAARALAGTMLLPVGLLGTTILFTDTPLACLWLGTIWVFLVAIKSHRIRWWILLGILLGLGLNTKFLIFNLMAMLAVYLVIDPQGRAALVTPGPYLATVIALVLMAPLIYWNATHEWQTFYFNFVKRRTSLGFHPWGMVVYALNQTMLVGPLFFIWCLIYPLGRSWEWVRQRRTLLLSLWLTGFVPFFLYSILKLFRPVYTSSVNWTAPLYTVLMILLAWAARDSRKWSRWGLIVSLQAGGITTCAMIAGLIGGNFLGPETMKSLIEPYTSEKRVKRYLKDFYGWEPVSREVDILYRKYNAVSPTFVMLKTYMHASIVSEYTRSLPLALSMGYDKVYGRCFDYWNEPEKHVGWDCLFVTNHPISDVTKKMIEDAFESVRELTPEERVYQHPIAKLFHIYYCHKAKYLPGEVDMDENEVQN